MWPDDPRLRDAALDLYGAVWEHVPPGIRQARAWGSDWFAVSTPFVVQEGERILAHAGVVVCELSFAGRRTEVAAVHGVCVRPEARGRGLGRRVIEEALRWIDGSGRATTILWSEKVDLYRRFGFAPVPESVFVGPAPAAAPTTARRLDLDRPADLARLLDLLELRQPVSGVAAAADRGWHFSIDLGLWREAQEMLVHLPEHDAVAILAVVDGTLCLYDLLSRRPPPVAALVGAAQAATGRAVERLEVYVGPDLLDVALEPAPHPFEDVLQVRGAPLPIPDGVAFALSPFTRT